MNNNTSMNDMNQSPEAASEQLSDISEKMAAALEEQKAPSPQTKPKPASAPAFRLHKGEGVTVNGTVYVVIKELSRGRVVMKPKVSAG